MRWIPAIVLMSCAGPSADNESLDAADDSNTKLNGAIADKVVLGATLQAVVHANLRDAPTKTSLVLRVVPAGSRVTVTGSASPSKGFYYVSHSGLVGWMNGAHLKFIKAPATPPAVDDVPEFTPDEPVIEPPPPPPPVVPVAPPAPMQDPREAAIARAQTGVGFSYWWGGSRWDPNGVTSDNAGSCTGVCGDCAHAGSWGADCSGYVAKVWQVPAGNDDLTRAWHPYSTLNFTNETHEWTTVDRDAPQLADAFTYRGADGGHIFLYESTGAWGDVWAYEAKACAIGIVHNLRTVSAAYKAIRREGY